MRIMGPMKIGKYIVKDVLGQGGMGTVYRALDPVIDREVAIKMIQERAMSPAIKERFYREAKSAGRLSHENIMTVHDVGERDGSPYLVMELLGGSDLREILEDQSRLPLAEKLDIALQICRGLAYAHSQQVIHRDIKPENIRVLEKGRVKIMDFGLARIESDTLTHTSMGTPRYMSPEQVKGEEIDQRTDIFSFGVLLYELLAGVNPFSGERVSTTIYKILHEEPEPVRIDDHLPGDELQRIVSRCIEKDVDRRYQSFEAVIDDLNAVISGRYGGRTLTQAVSPAASGQIHASSAEPKLAARLWRVALGTLIIVGAVGGGYLMVQQIDGFTSGGETRVEDPVPSDESSLPAQDPETRRDAVADAASEAGTDTPNEQSTETPSAASQSQNTPAAPEDDSPESTTDDTSPGTRQEPSQSAEEEQSRLQEQTQQNQVRAARDRQSMEQARRSVGERHYDPSTVEDYRRAEKVRAYGEQQYENEAFVVAGQSFREAEMLYEGVPDSAEPDVETPSDPAVTGDKAATDQVQENMLAAKEAVRSLLHQKPSYEKALRLELQGQEVYEARAFDRALEYFREAEGVFEKVAAMPTPEEEVGGVLQDLTAQLKSSLETENVEGLYALSPFYAKETWTEFFRFVKNINADIHTGDVTVDGTAATVVVTVRLEYLNNKNENQDSRFDYVWTLENADGSSWMLTNVENE